MKTRTQMIVAILLSEKRSLERFNYITSLTDNQVQIEYFKLNN